MHWCLGMYASGSTWLFNVALQVGASLTPARPPIGRYITNAGELGLDQDVIERAIVKTHDVDDPSAETLRRLASSLLISIRDPRDCVSSLLLYQRYPFELALKAVEDSAQCCARFVAEPHTVLLRYEDGFTDQPSTLDRVAASFNDHLPEEERARILPRTAAHVSRPELPHWANFRPRFTTPGPVTLSIQPHNGTAIMRAAVAKSAAGGIC